MATMIESGRCDTMIEAVLRIVIDHYSVGLSCASVCACCLIAE